MTLRSWWFAVTASVSARRAVAVVLGMVVSLTTTLGAPAVVAAAGPRHEVVFPAESEAPGTRHDMIDGPADLHTADCHVDVSEWYSPTTLEDHRGVYNAVGGVINPIRHDDSRVLACRMGAFYLQHVAGTTLVGQEADEVRPAEGGTLHVQGVTLGSANCGHAEENLHVYGQAYYDTAAVDLGSLGIVPAESTGCGSMPTMAVDTTYTFAAGLYRLFSFPDVYWRTLEVWFEGDDGGAVYGGDCNGAPGSGADNAMVWGSAQLTGNKAGWGDVWVPDREACYTASFTIVYFAPTEGLTSDDTWNIGVAVSATGPQARVVASWRMGTTLQTIFDFRASGDASKGITSDVPSGATAVVFSIYGGTYLRSAVAWDVDGDPELDVDTGVGGGLDTDYFGACVPPNEGGFLDTLLNVAGWVGYVACISQAGFQLTIDLTGQVVDAVRAITGLAVTVTLGTVSDALDVLGAIMQLTLDSTGQLLAWATCTNPEGSVCSLAATAMAPIFDLFGWTTCINDGPDLCSFTNETADTLFVPPPDSTAGADLGAWFEGKAPFGYVTSIVAGIGSAVSAPAQQVAIADLDIAGATVSIDWYGTMAALDPYRGLLLALFAWPIARLTISRVSAMVGAMYSDQQLTLGM